MQVTSVNAVSPTKLGETKKNVSKSTNLPGVERQKGQQHVGKAGNREKALKLESGKTCVTW
ncbi:hypothetical protein [Desmonostoc muscorum]|uniref:hypothetical protein n=1 Tax=Desmonostoc muscorum TaxID=1179 RepID=UPI001F2362B6|nr:hypothetical protein [Desmonostoc muscorum]